MILAHVVRVLCLEATGSTFIEEPEVANIYRAIAKERAQLDAVTERQGTVVALLALAVQAWLQRFRSGSALAFALLYRLRQRRVFAFSTSDNPDEVRKVRRLRPRRVHARLRVLVLVARGRVEYGLELLAERHLVPLVESRRRIIRPVHHGLHLVLEELALILVALRAAVVAAAALPHQLLELKEAREDVLDMVEDLQVNLEQSLVVIEDQESREDRLYNFVFPAALIVDHLHVGDDLRAAVCHPPQHLVLPVRQEER